MEASSEIGEELLLAGTVLSETRVSKHTKGRHLRKKSRKKERKKKKTKDRHQGSSEEGLTSSPCHVFSLLVWDVTRHSSFESPTTARWSSGLEALARGSISRPGQWATGR